MRAALGKFFKRSAQNLARQIESRIGKIAKTSADDEALQQAHAKRIAEILADLDYTFWDELPEDVYDYLMVVAEDGAREAIAQVQKPGETLPPDVLDQAHTEAVEWAKERAAELVGKKWVDGELVDNPDARWQIDTDARAAIQDTVVEALDEGMSWSQLADALEQIEAFSEARAETIARTELARADTEGSRIGWRGMGVTEQEWKTGADCCDLCDELDGEIVGIDEQFSEDGPPAHPNCRCAVLPVIETIGD